MKRMRAEKILPVSYEEEEPNVVLRVYAPPPKKGVYPEARILLMRREPRRGGMRDVWAGKERSSICLDDIDPEAVYYALVAAKEDLAKARALADVPPPKRTRHRPSLGKELDSVLDGMVDLEAPPRAKPEPKPEPEPEPEPEPKVDWGTFFGV